MPAGGKPYGPKSGRKKSDAGANAYDTGMKMRQKGARDYNLMKSPSDRAWALNLGVKSARMTSPGTTLIGTADSRLMPTSNANDMAARARGMSMPPKKAAPAKKAGAPAKGPGSVGRMGRTAPKTVAKKAAPAKRGSRRMG